ncbi:Response regulator PleD [compost metagenome]
MIDIDNFKKVNDQFGHDIGDEVLKRTADNIKASVSEFEFARLGGEEFVIYLWGVSQADAEQRVEALCRRVREDATEHPVTISIKASQLTLHSLLTHAASES